MRLAPFLALLALVLGAAPPADAEWLILNGGKRIQTEGTWTLNADLLTVHETTGRTLTVAIDIVDAGACLKVNAGTLRIQAFPFALPKGAPAIGRQIWPDPLANSATRPAAGIPPRTISPSSRTPAGRPAASRPSRPSELSAEPLPADRPAAADGVAAAPAAAAATNPPPSGSAGTDPKARKLARQAELQRELHHHQIVEGCRRLFIVDGAGFQRCVQAQWP